MNYPPLVSILVPVYGVEQYIERCARSLFEQTYDNLEFIFVDDCSKDRSIELLENVLGDYPNRQSHVNIVRHSQNKGLAAARNMAVAASKGDYIMHVDSDDYLIGTNAIESIVAFALEEESDMVVFDRKNVYSDYEVELTQNIPHNKNEYLKQIVSRNNVLTVWGLLIKKSLYTKNHICCIEGVNVGEDYFVKVQLVYFANKISYLPKHFYAYNLANISSYTSMASMSNFRQIKQTMDYIEAFLKREEANDLLTCLDYARYYIKVYYIHAWPVISCSKDEFDEIKSIECREKYKIDLPFQYKISYVLSKILTPALYHYCRKILKRR